MFRAITLSYNDLPSDVNRAALDTARTEENYLVIQMDGRTICCKPESELLEGLEMIMELMELSYYLGALAGIKHEQNFMGGRKLEDLPGGPS
jgi:hypothetical protein